MKPTLPTNYKDDILNTSVEGMRRYQMIYNSDNTVSFKDVTPYDQTGSDFGAGDINLTNQAVNQSADAGKIIDDPDTAEATTEEGYIAGVQLFNHVTDSLGGLRFGVDGEGNYGYFGADDSLIPFSSGVVFTVSGSTNPSARLANIDVSKKKTIKVNIAYNSGSNLSNQWLDIVGDDNVITSVKTMTYEETLDVSNYSTLLIRGSANGNANAINNSVTCAITV